MVVCLDHFGQNFEQNIIQKDVPDEKSTNLVHHGFAGI